MRSDTAHPTVTELCSCLIARITTIYLREMNTNNNHLFVRIGLDVKYKKKLCTNPVVQPYEVYIWAVWGWYTRAMESETSSSFSWHQQAVIAYSLANEWAVPFNVAMRPVRHFPRWQRCVLFCFLFFLTLFIPLVHLYIFSTCLYIFVVNVST